MTDSMVERVARALCVVNAKDPDWPIAGTPYWKAYEREARAAIEAMLPPTLVMLHAGNVADASGLWQAPQVYTAMITAALDTRDDGQVAETAGALAPSVQE
jgi:hypothetical protein